MRIQWMTAPLLVAFMAAGCSERSSETPPDTPATESTTAEVAPADDARGEPETTPPSRSVTTDREPPARGGANRAAAPAPAPRTVTENRSPSVNTAPLAPGRTPEVARDARPSAPVAAARIITIPAGTSLPLELTTPVSTETASIEMPVTARLRRAVTVDDVTVFPAGATVSGEVVDVDRPGRVRGRARLGLRFMSVTVAGRREDIRTNPVTFQGEQTKGEDAAKIGAGAGIGAVIGGIVGGGDGAAKGAAIGGAAGTGAVLATRGRDVSLPSGTDINATLASAVEVERR